MTTARHDGQAGRTAPADDDQSGYRQRLLDAFAASIVEDGYRDTTVADIVRRARTSRRTFYEHFASKEACFVELVADVNAEMMRQISVAVNPHSPWQDQVRQAIEAWIAYAESQLDITLSWIREVPSLDVPACRQDITEAFVDMIQALCDTERCAPPVSARCRGKSRSCCLAGCANWRPPPSTREDKSATWPKPRSARRSPCSAHAPDRLPAFDAAILT